ncbi:MAG: hypothetical protein A2494_02770 [Candidatus Lloydbacteria bacterium RIFOXYC12_FULL_46_25]|uniref:Uncharacterized protein n=1 Tax=Candidatus Lloydbacteria bacterium RIFOXYC12_FULL_46_25 TaxID=1798670 RepID=A0A1G2DZT7_9BACT|nr:MAG: hypothetical protein A2494_02770 [Candidatus Lloydbacteria bacterium RIFOXYC12_FULL_46_25]
MTEGVPTNEERMSMHEEIPSTPEGLHSYIVEELGDTELARRVAERPDLTREYVLGDGLPGLPFFKMTEEVGRINEKLGKSLLRVAVENERLLDTPIDRVVGNGFSDAEKEDYLFYKQFETTKNAASPYAHERGRTPFENEAIHYADQKIDELRQSFGLEPFPIIPPQVHVFPTAELSHGEMGKTDIYKGEIRLAESEEGAGRLNLIIHESLHLKSYAAVQVDQNDTGEIGVRSYRLGLSVNSRDVDKDEVYLNGLNEAVTEELANRMLFSIPDDHPVFGGVVRAHKERIAVMIKEHPDHFDELRRPTWITSFRENQVEMEKARHSYTKERQVMFRLFNAIYTANPERFSGKTKEEAEEEMFEMLAKGAFTGNILPFGRLFNETFGRGTFREFGHLQTNKEQEEFLRKL